MIAGGGLNALRLLDAEGAPARPSGMVVPGSAVADLAARLARRAKHYAALRVTALPDALVLWSVADQVALPWSDDDPLYLAQAGKAVFFPVATRIDLPGKWAEGVIDRLAAAKSLSRPILLLPANAAEKPSPMGRGLGEGMCPIDKSDPLTPLSPHGRGLRLRAIGLGKNSAPVPAIDWAELAWP